MYAGLRENWVSGFPRQVEFTTIDPTVDLSEDANISTECGGYVFVLDEEAYCACEETVEFVFVDELL